ncbi:MAG: hypothetical protein AVDCRST_MAG19-4834 [uncultured Thermomicrobiales bacterium]|uniref:Uncharacterized protein n=1 Tax=uncultured Thermomicrobiales bacterium TaxID=1645740 RepID=A0A6J4VQY9_9BACT|nr:MAG: hypothetical protein AVDCRST_MAG19-4834 [uncultured Thermomicrobiales bacterium]
MPGTAGNAERGHGPANDQGAGDDGRGHVDDGRRAGADAGGREPVRPDPEVLTPCRRQDAGTASSPARPCGCRASERPPGGPGVVGGEGGFVLDPDMVLAPGVELVRSERLPSVQ